MFFFLRAVFLINPADHVPHIILVDIADIVVIHIIVVIVVIHVDTHHAMDMAMDVVFMAIIVDLVDPGDVVVDHVIADIVGINTFIYETKNETLKN